MNKKQIARLSMLYNVQRTCNEARSVWSAHSAFAAGVAELDALLREVEDAVETQLANTTGQARSKAASAEAMLGLAQVVARAATAYAQVVDHRVLLAQMRIPGSLLRRTSNVLLARRCQAILEAAEPHLVALADYGVDQARLDALRTAILDHQQLVTAPRQAIMARKAATERIRMALRRSADLLRYRLDGLLVQFATTAPDFHRAYRNARIVVDAASAKAAPALPQVIPLVPPAQQQAA